MKHLLQINLKYILVGLLISNCYLLSAHNQNNLSGYWLSTSGNAFYLQMQGTGFVYKNLNLKVNWNATFMGYTLYNQPQYKADFYYGGIYVHSMYFTITSPSRMVVYDTRNPYNSYTWSKPEKNAPPERKSPGSDENPW